MPKKGNVIKASDLMFRDGSQSFSSNATFDAKVMIRDGASVNQGPPTITLALGDQDTGFEWNSDGNISLYANSQEVINFTETTITAKKPLSMNNNSISGVSGLTMSGVITFGAGQSLPPGKVSGTAPTQGIVFSADTDSYRLFMREDSSGENTGLILQLADNTDDYFQIEQVSPYGEATPTILFKISESAGANFTTALKVNGNTVWHAGNDGASSGLDADLLDGLHASQFLRSDTSGTLNGNLTLNGSLIRGNTTLNLNTAGWDKNNGESNIAGEIVAGTAAGDARFMFHSNAGKMNVYVDGTIYVNEGANRVIDWSSVALSGSGEPLGKIAYINTDSVMEVGRFIDFHTNGSSADYDVRLDCVSSDELRVIGGVLNASGGFVLESRTSDPSNPVVGQMWLRTDLV